MPSSLIGEQFTDSCHPEDEALRSSETVGCYKTHTGNISEDGILHSHSRENLKSYIALADWTL
jgi:hypothetical protein